MQDLGQGLSHIFLTLQSQCHTPPFLPLCWVGMSEVSSVRHGS